MKKRKTKTCLNCGEEISLSNYERHIVSKSCLIYGGKRRNKAVIYPWNEWEISSNFFKLPCGYEGDKRSCTNYLIAQKISHKGKCNLFLYNKERKDKGLPAHNKGVPNSLEQRIKISKSLKIYNKNNPNKKHTEKAKENMSKAKKSLYRKHPEKHPNNKLARNRSKMTYPEQVAHDWFLDHEICAPHNKYLSGYYPDFRVGMIIIEIDGERWHSSPEQVASDRKRDKKLTSLGYTIYRIRSKENIQKRLGDIFGLY